MTKTRGALPKRLTSLPEDLRARGFEPPEYRYLREAAVNRVIPAHQINNRDKGLMLQRPRRLRSSKATRCVPICEVRPLCRGLRPHYA
jgi:hypothetical protein